MKINHDERSAFEDYCSLLNPKCVNRILVMINKLAEYADGSGLEAQISPRLDGHFLHLPALSREAF